MKNFLSRKSAEICITAAPDFNRPLLADCLYTSGLFDS